MSGRPSKVITWYLFDHPQEAPMALDHLLLDEDRLAALAAAYTRHGLDAPPDLARKREENTAAIQAALRAELRCIEAEEEALLEKPEKRAKLAATKAQLAKALQRGGHPL